MSSNTDAFDPFRTLGLSPSVTEEQLRARYLELVRAFPPERDPDRFREIQAAFEAAKDPLLLAERLAEPPDDVVPPWSTVIEEQRKNRPRLTTSFLLSLGNRPEGEDADRDQLASKQAEAREHGTSSIQSGDEPHA